MGANRKTGLAIFLSLGFGITARADAESITNVSVTGVGNQATQLYATLATTPPGCRAGVVYHSSENQAGQHVMSILLAARLSNRPIARIDYTIRPDGSCWINLIEL